LRELHLGHCGSKWEFRYDCPERQEINRPLIGGLQPLRTVLRALALPRLADGQSNRKQAARVIASLQTRKRQKATIAFCRVFN
jgi:hypothetical protein